MALLSIRVLGPFQVRIAEEPVAAFATDKVRALLVYLALSPDQPHRRETLAGMLWPDFPEHSARANLRNALANLRQVIRDGATSPPFLFSTRQTIEFNGESDYWLDADAFEDLLALQPTMSANLEAAISLSRGLFLSGFGLADAAPFDDWLLLHREHYRRLVIEASDKLVAVHEGQGAFERALVHARRRVELEPWQEEGQRQLIRLLARSGRRAEAMTAYETHCRELAAELGVTPAAETTYLFEQIRDDALDLTALAPGRGQRWEPSPRVPGFLTQSRDAVEPPVFVTREKELARLQDHLLDALAGNGHTVFVSGGPGRGKTALLAEFGRRASAMVTDLLVARGQCNAFSGVGDPYLPFRDLMAMLTGDVEPRWSAGAMSTAQARRLWNALPSGIHCLLQHGPDVTESLVEGQALLSRAALWCATTTGDSPDAEWLHRLRRRVERQRIEPEGTEQVHLFQQVTNVLRNLSLSHPLMLILDDLQWADVASIGLLFHLGLRLEGARILIAGAYRAEEVALSTVPAGAGAPGVAGTGQPGRHPLVQALGEFKRRHGDIEIDLIVRDDSEKRRFVEALLETEPNLLGEEYRKQLVSRADGHPLFTIELMRAMQARGDLIQDAEGRWIEGPALDWETLPSKVQGAIETRIGRLEPELRKMLAVACVEGEELTLEVAAHVLGKTEAELLPLVVEELVRRHRLLLERTEMQIGSNRLSRFGFSHALVQKYLYQRLSWAERRLLHGKVAAALESCYGERAGDFAVQLARHYAGAGDDERALHYFIRAADNAQGVYANAEARVHYTRAIAMAKRVLIDTGSVIKLRLSRGRVNQRLGDFEAALADYETALQFLRGKDEDGDELLAWQAMTHLGKLWSSRDYHRAYDYFEDALALAERLGDPKVLAQSQNWMGNWHLNQADPQAAVTYHQEALSIVEEKGSERDLAVTLDLLGIANLLAGDMTACAGYYDRAIALFRKMDDRPNLATSLTGRGHAGSSAYIYLTLIPATIPVSPRRDFAEAAHVTRQIGSLAGEAWVCWSIATLEIVQGRYGQAQEVLQRGLDIARQIGHREWIAGCRCFLGRFYQEILAAEEGQEQLRLALDEAEELGSWVWVRHAIGELAGIHLWRADTARASALLDQVLCPETPMDTMNKRYCWVRRAEVALQRGEAALALDIVERLISTAPGMVPGRVITYLWKLKGEALAAGGDIEAGCRLLRTAIENARSTGERFLLWRLHASLGQLHCAADRRPQAEMEFMKAREVIQELADSLPDGALRNRFIVQASESLSVPDHNR